ncbi:hypothetical protein GCM10028801_11950 [Nocardioides maradonensis]
MIAIGVVVFGLSLVLLYALGRASSEPMHWDAERTLRIVP